MKYIRTNLNTNTTPEEKEEMKEIFSLLAQNWGIAGLELNKKEENIMMSCVAIKVGVQHLIPYIDNVLESEVAKRKLKRDGKSFLKQLEEQDAKHWDLFHDFFYKKKGISYEEMETIEEERKEIYHKFLIALSICDQQELNKINRLLTILAISLNINDESNEH